MVASDDVALDDGTAKVKVAMVVEAMSVEEAVDEAEGGMTAVSGDDVALEVATIAGTSLVELASRLA